MLCSPITRLRNILTISRFSLRCRFSALFYIISELYSSVSIGILFWGYANEVIGVEQARRFYPLFGQMSSLGPIAAGQYVVQYSSKADNFQSR